MHQQFTAEQIAEKTGGKVVGCKDLVITGLNTLEHAQQGEMTFIGDSKHAGLWKDSSASVALVTRTVEVPDHDPTKRALILVDNADLAMADVLELFSPPRPSVAPGIHPTAIVDPTAVIPEDACIGPFVCIGSHVKIGNGTVLHAHVVVMDETRIGNDCTIWPNVVVRERCILGNRVVLHSGVIIGADGFGYRPTPDGKGIRHIPHIGNVEIGDDVEVGANSAIDRGKFGATTIGQGTKIDNLVQIGHNCRVGCCCMLSGQVGLAGSVVLEDGVIIGGGTGIKDHTTIGAGAKLAARSAFMGDVPAGETWGGAPAMPLRELFRKEAFIRKLMTAKGKNREKTHSS